jgi:F0F1-type ATP synthase assembly protein I
MVPAAWLLGAGWYFALCVIGGVLLGLWLDSETGLEPLFLLLCILLGLAVALVGGIRMVRPVLKMSEERDRNSGTGK